MHYTRKETMNVIHWTRSHWTCLLLGLLLPVACLAEIPSVGELHFWRDPSDLAVDGSRVFVCSWLKGVGSFDLANPSAPVETMILPWETVNIEDGLAVVGNRLYAGTNSGEFRIYDITVPAHPVLLSQLPMPGGVAKILVHDTLAAVRHWTDHTSLVNFANPAAPVAYAEFDAGELLGFVDGYLCTTAGMMGLWVWDISNPNSPVIAASAVPTPAENFSSGLLAGHTAYCPRVNEDLPLGLRIIDLTNPLAPVIRGSIDDYDIWYEGLAEIDSTLYLSQAPGGGIAAWNIRNLSAPQFVGTYAPTRHFGSLFDCDGNLGAATRIAPRILSLFDVSNPASPQPLSAFGSYASLTTLKVHDQHLFAGDANGGLHVLDLQQPAAPREICFADSMAAVYDFTLEGDHAYLASSLSGLQVVNLADPDHPALESHLSLAGTTHECRCVRNVRLCAELHRVDPLPDLCHQYRRSRRSRNHRQLYPAILDRQYGVAWHEPLRGGYDGLHCQSCRSCASFNHF